MTEPTRTSDDSPHSNSRYGTHSFFHRLTDTLDADRIGDFKNLEEHGSRFEVMSQCHAWEGQDHE